jgi:transposase InsO family protein
MKPSNLAPPGKLRPLELPDIPWAEVTTDFTTDLPLSNGFDSILVVVDRFSKEVEFIPCNKTTTALDTARLYLHNVWKNHGLPSSIVSDRGPQFASQVMRDLCKRLGIQPKLSTAFHPQTDGQTERMNRDLQQYLRLFTAEKQDEWVNWLPLAQFSYNTKKQASTQKSPFEVTRSYVPRMGFEQRIIKAPAAEKFTSIMQNTLAQTKANLEKAQDRMKAQADKHRSIAPKY